MCPPEHRLPVHFLRLPIQLSRSAKIAKYVASRGKVPSLQGQYLINTTEEEFLTSAMFKTARSGVQQRVDANTNITLFNYLTLSPGVNYREVWNFQSAEKAYDETIQNSDGSFGGVVTDTIAGFRSFREYSASLNLTTNIYGTFEFKKGRLKALRHTIRPSVSFNYRPDFADQRYNCGRHGS